MVINALHLKAASLTESTDGDWYYFKSCLSALECIIKAVIFSLLVLLLSIFLIADKTLM